MITLNKDFDYIYSGFNPHIDINIVLHILITYIIQATSPRWCGPPAGCLGWAWQSPPQAGTASPPHLYDWPRVLRDRHEKWPWYISIWQIYGLSGNQSVQCLCIPFVSIIVREHVH